MSPSSFRVPGLATGAAVAAAATPASTVPGSPLRRSPRITATTAPTTVAAAATTATATRAGPRTRQEEEAVGAGTTATRWHRRQRQCWQQGNNAWHTNDEITVEIELLCSRRCSARLLSVNVREALVQLRQREHKSRVAALVQVIHNCQFWAAESDF